MTKTLMEIRTYVANQIKHLRDHYNNDEGLSQEALAIAIKVAPNTISRWETGVYEPGLNDLEKLARFFGVPLLHFLPPESIKPEGEKLMALLRTARQLHPSDLEELRRYAEFRRARRIYKGKSRPGPGRKKVKKT